MIKRYFYILCLLFVFTQTYAQPSNDECSTAVQLGTAPFGSCTTNEYTNVDATLSDDLFSNPVNNIPSCWPSVDNDVWFQFETPADGSFVDFEISVTSTGTNPIGQFKVALYRGECLLDELSELGCEVGAPGDTQIKFPTAVTSALTPGISYFIRVDDQSATAAPVWGTFNVCVDSIPDLELMCDATGSTDDSGTVYDSGGPDGDYQNNEDCTYTICPTTPPGCIILTVNMHDTEIDPPGGASGDELNFYDGTSTFAPNIGDDIHGGGSCYTVQATSGCVTIEWESNNTVTNPGFEISWESTAGPCPTFTGPNLTTSPMESLIIEKLGALPNTVSNVTIDCADNAHGAFDGTDNSFLFMDEGIILTTGSADYAFTPNDGPGDPETDNNNNTDLDLSNLSAEIEGTQPNMGDACILEMDVLAAADEISLEYIFGSDEYIGNANNGTPSDVMGIWVSGPGIIGDPLYNNQELISLLPGTNTPVHLFNINNADNFEYFRWNFLTDLGPRYDGLTTDFFSIDKKTLTATAQVQACSTYHIKVAIADNNAFFGGGGDSGIFFGDLDIGLPDAALAGTTSFDYLVEGCTNTDQLDLNLTNPLGEDLTLTVTIGGTATQGTDYTLNLPTTITFPAGTTNLNFPMTVIADGIMEGTETIELAFNYDFGCGQFDFATVVIEIEDAPLFELANGADTLFVCSGGSIQLNASGAQTYSWSPAGALDNPNIANPVATPTTSGFYTVTGNLGVCTLTEQVWLEVLNPTVSVDASQMNICEGTSVQLNAINNVGNVGLSWSPSLGLNDITIANPTASPPQTITYTATVAIAGCSVSDQVTINVDPFEFPTLTTTDTVLCQGDSLVLASSTSGSQTDYAWTPNTDIIDADESDAVVFPMNNTTYTLTATSPNAFCQETATVAIEVVPATLEIQGGNDYELCLGETVELTALTSTNGVGFTWTPDSSLTSGTATTVTASPDLTTTYIAQLIVGGCTLQEMVNVKVDSLPITAIEIIPNKDTYCKDEIISFVSPSIDIGFFPDIEFAWTPNDGSFLSDADNFNLAITATESQTYTRTITNGGCSNTESVTIEVIEVDVELNTMDIALCLNEQLPLEATGAENYTWSPSSLLSCNDCPNPTLTANSDAQITVVGDTDGCQDVESFNLTISPSPTDCIILGLDSVGIGEIVQLNTTYISSSPVTIEWFSGSNLIGQGDSIEVAAISTSNKFDVIITNSEGCSCTDSINIAGIKPVLTMPNAFTPDGDGVNDFFNILFTSEETDKVIDKGSVEIIQFTVFNRWGNVVYENDTPDTGWDGTDSDKSATSDVYVYLVEIEFPDGTTEVASGDVTLIR